MAKLVKIESAADMLFTPPAGYVTSTIGTDEEGLITELIKKSDGTITSIGGGGSGSSDGYVAVEVDGVLKAQKLAFDGTTASASGDPEAIGAVGIFNTGKDEPAYKGMGGGAFYKCASVDTANKTWTGYEAIVNGDTGVWSFSEEVTSGLPYNKLTPQVGKVYDEECTFMVSGFDSGSLIPEEGLVFYAPLSQDYKDTVNGLEPTQTTGSFTEYNGKPMLYIPGGTEGWNVIWDNCVDLPINGNPISLFAIRNITNAYTCSVFGCTTYSGTYRTGEHFGNSSFLPEIHNNRGSAYGRKNSLSSVCITKDIDGLVTVYLNGEVQQTYTVTEKDTELTRTYLGACREGSVTGYFSDFAIYNRALTADEILSMHNNLMPQ